MAKKAGTSLGLSIFFIIGLLVVLTAGSALVATVIGSRQTKGEISADLRRINAAQAVLQKKRFNELELIGRQLANESWIVRDLRSATSGTNDATEMRTRVEDLRAERSLDLVVFFGPKGKVVFRSGVPEEPPMDADLTSNPLFATLLPSGDGDSQSSDPQSHSATALWALDGGLYSTAITKLTRDYEPIGYLGIAATITPLAEELQRTTGAATLIFVDSPTGPTTLASTHASPDQVIASLRVGGQVLTRIKRGETIPDADLKLNGEPWLAFLTPLRDAADQPVGAVVGLAAMGSRLTVYRQMQWLLLLVGGGALITGLLLSLLLGYRVLAPVSRLATAVQEIASGRYEPDLPPAKGNFGSLVKPLGILARQLNDKEALASYLEQRRREIPEPARPAASDTKSAPVARQLALVAVEMRRYANPKLGYDPEENIARFARDLRRVSDTVTARQGTVESIQGHRLLAIFEGEGHSSRALAAATEVLLALTHRENAFDEPVTPVIGLTQGSVVTGSVRWGAQDTMAVAGLPIQQLESLLREATPGDIFMAKPIAEELYPAIQTAGVELQAQHGLVSPMTLYKLSAEAAVQFTGAELPQDQPRVTAQNLTPSDVVVGEILGGRFEILAELGSGPLGVVFKARDNERADLIKIKVLKPEVLAEPAHVERLKQSLELVRMISQSNVLGVFDFGQVDGLAYISANFVKGTSLRFFLQENRSVPLTPAFLLARQVVEGLRVAHRQKLTHGSLKPENVLVEPTGRVKVMDFGLGKTVGSDQREQLHPAAAYMAPEQIDGHPGTFTTDVYAWGVLFYEMVTGHVPAAGATPAEVGRQRQNDILEPPSLRCDGMPPALDAIVLRCLEASPSDRFSTSEDLAQALDGLRA